MRLGMFPGQAEELKRLARKGLDAERRSRRQFVAASAAVVLTGVSAFLFGRWSAAGSEPVRPDAIRERWAKKIPWAEAIAMAPIDDLVAARSTFLMTIERTEGTEGMWRGFGRLAERAIAQGDRELAKRLLEVVQIAPPPPAATRLLEALRGVH